MVCLQIHTQHSQLLRGKSSLTPLVLRPDTVDVEVLVGAAAEDADGEAAKGEEEGGLHFWGSLIEGYVVVVPLGRCIRW